jgi:amidase
LNRILFKDVGLKCRPNPEDEPVARVDPGETLVLEIEDTYMGQIRKKGDSWSPSESVFGNPVVGPIYVNGAGKGSTISIAVEEIRPTISRGFACFDEFCENYLTGTPVFTFMEMHLPRQPKVYEIANELISFSDNITIPYQPMIGTIGTAPQPELQSISSVVLPDRHGVTWTCRT